MAPIIGIDLGTTNSAVAVMEKNGPIIVPNNLGERTTPSVVGFTKSGDILVGKKARRGAIMNVGRTVFSIKRHMGTDHRVKIDGKEYTPQEISAMILQKMKQDAEDYFGEEISQAVITVPAYFTDAQRQATKDAGEIAGLNVRRIIDEPTAAALAYGLDKKEDQVLLVYDLGGGTFDVSIIEIVSGVFRVMGINGNTRLGGDDFDNRIVDYLVKHFKETTGVDLSGDPIAMQRLKEQAEETKIDLSEVRESHVLCEAITMSDKGPLTLETTITRVQFEDMIRDLVESTRAPIDHALTDAGMKKEQLDTVLLVGGSTRIPMVQELVKNHLKAVPSRDISPEEVVALGAAVQTSVLAPLGESFEDSEATFYNKEDRMVVVHMTPFSIGVGLENDQFGTLIERNSTYPTEAKDIFTTTRDFQEAISFPIYEGESPVASENTFLDLLRIEGITPAPRGVPPQCGPHPRGSRRRPSDRCREEYRDRGNVEQAQRNRQGAHDRRSARPRDQSASRQGRRDCRGRSARNGAPCGNRPAVESQTSHGGAARGYDQESAPSGQQRRSGGCRGRGARYDAHAGSGRNRRFLRKMA
jgi:molecular chaperone DnaK